MKDPLQIVKKRSAPGVLIFDTKGQLLYANREAMEILPDPESIPGEILQCHLMEGEAGANWSDGWSGSPPCVVLTGRAGGSYSARSFPMRGQREDTEKTTQIMVLIEKIVEKRPIDFEEASIEFGLTARELEVVRLVSEGYSNQNISGILFIGSDTVKWHIKNIMRKMGAGSRSEMISLLR